MLTLDRGGETGGRFRVRVTQRRVVVYVDPFLMFAVSMNDIGGHHSIGPIDIPGCFEDAGNSARGAGTLGITNVSYGAFQKAASMFPQLRETGGSMKDNWRNIACNARYSVRSTAFYLKYVEYKFNEEIAHNPGSYKIVTDSAYAYGPISVGADDHWLHQGVDDPPMMQAAMQGTKSASESGFGGPNGGGGSFNTRDLIPLARRFYCGSGSSHYSY